MSLWASATAAEGLGFDTPFGPATSRAIAHRSTAGAIVVITAVKDGAGVSTEARSMDGGAVLPRGAEVEAPHPQN